MVDKKVNHRIADMRRTKNQTTKVMFGVLVILGLATFLLGVLKVAQGIYGPFISLRLREGVSTETGDVAGSVSDLIKLQAQDTDGDSLSDYDEVYVYGTSPYLEDSDSDGYSDKQEVVSGHDPNCAAGKDCYAMESSVDESGKALEEIPVEPESAELSPDVLSELEKLSADELRELLLSSGQITQEQLDQIDDETLLETFRETLGEQDK